MSTVTIATVNQMSARETGRERNVPIMRLSAEMMAMKTSSTGKIMPFTN